MSKIKISIKNEGDACLISLSGNIDESFAASMLLENKKNFYKIDLNEIKLINSFGVREWTRFIEALGPNTRIEYHHCPAMVIQHMNIIEGFLTSNASVISFYATYFCDENDEEKSVLIKSADIKNNQPPVVHTMVDGQKVEMEFDGVPERYFKFLRKDRK